MSLLHALSTNLNSLLCREVLGPVLQQRAKFEGWLKIELAYALQRHGLPVQLEEPIPGTRHRADLAVESPEGELFYIMLKTVNTNFRFPGVDRRTRPITQNISAVIDDVEKLISAASGQAGLVVFSVFPVAANRAKRDAQLMKHIARIEAILVAENFIVPPSSNGSWGVAWFIFRV